MPEPPDGLAHEARTAWARRDLAARGVGAGRGAAGGVRALGVPPLPDQLTEVCAPARDFGSLVRIHAAENTPEVATVEVKYGKRPVQLPDSLGLLGPDVLLARAVDLTGPEIAAPARTGTAVAHCPGWNLERGCGIAPVPRLLSAGVPVGPGTDGAVSSNSPDVLGRCGRRRWCTRRAATRRRSARSRPYGWRRSRGARALGLGDRLGSLGVGRRADLVVLDLAAPHLRPAHGPWSTPAYEARSSDVWHAVVDGRVLMRDRVLTTLDERAAIADLEALVAPHPGRSADVRA